MTFGLENSFAFGKFSDFYCITPKTQWGGKGAQFPGRRITARGLKYQQCHKHFFQNTTFASERRQVRTWGRQTCFLPQAPSNLVTPLHNAHHDYLAKMTKFVYKNTCPSMANDQSQNIWNKMLLISGGLGGCWLGCSQGPQHLGGPQSLSR